MRFNKKVTFIILSDNEPRFNPKTGNLDKSKPETVTKTCKVFDKSTEYKAKVFGKVDDKALVVIHLGRSLKADKAIYDGATYKVIDKRQMRGKATYLLGGLYGKN